MNEQLIAISTDGEDILDLMMAGRVHPIRHDELPGGYAASLLAFEPPLGRTDVGPLVAAVILRPDGRVSGVGEYASPGADSTDPDTLPELPFRLYAGMNRTSPVGHFDLSRPYVPGVGTVAWSQGRLPDPTEQWQVGVRQDAGTSQGIRPQEAPASPPSPFRDGEPCAGCGNPIRAVDLGLCHACSGRVLDQVFSRMADEMVRSSR